MEAIKLTPTQKIAADQVLACCRGERTDSTLEIQLALLTGPAGSGKTTTLKYILDELEEIGSVCVLAPTGMAALRASRVTGRAASTIHRWLYRVDMEHWILTGEMRFVRRTEETLNIPTSGVVIVDEWSMVSKELQKDLFATASEHNLTVVGVGDPFQLPPVEKGGWGQVVASPFDVPVTVHANLTEVMRQALQSPIIRAATCVREGKAAEGLAILREIPKSRLVETAAAITARGGAVIVNRNITRQTLNTLIRTSYGWGQQSLQPGERLICLKNDYLLGVMNGQAVMFERFTHPAEQVHVTGSHKDPNQFPGGLHTFIGAVVGGLQVILCLDLVAGGEKSQFWDLQRAAEAYATKYRIGTGRKVHFERVGPYGSAKMDDTSELFIPAPLLQATLGWAVTAHKMQGSEAPEVMVIIEPTIRMNEESGRRWLYTAITRAQESCVYAQWPREMPPQGKPVTFVARVPSRMLAVGCGGPIAPEAQAVVAQVKEAGGLLEMLGSEEVDFARDDDAADAVLDKYKLVQAVAIFESTTPTENDKARTLAYVTAAQARGLAVYFKSGTRPLAALPTPAVPGSTP